MQDKIFTKESFHESLAEIDTAVFDRKIFKLYFIWGQPSAALVVILVGGQ